MAKKAIAKMTPGRKKAAKREQADKGERQPNAPHSGSPSFGDQSQSHADADCRFGHLDRGRRPDLTPRSTHLPRSGHLETSARAILRGHRGLDRASRGWPAADARPLPGGFGGSVHLSQTREGLGSERPSSSQDPGEDQGRRIPRRRFNRGSLCRSRRWASSKSTRGIQRWSISSGPIALSGISIQGLPSRGNRS